MSASANNPIVLDAEQIARSIDDGWARYITHENGSAATKRPYTYASSYEVCDRKLVLHMTEGDKVLPFPTEVLAKFHRGNDRERNMIIDLTRVGQFAEPKFSVIGQQERFQLRDHKGRVAIAGKVDLRLDYGYKQPSVPVEVKDWHSNLTERIKTFEDVFDNPWTRKGGYQLLCYLFGSGEKTGLLLLARPGLPRLIPVELYPYLDRVEEFLMKAERALDHKEAGTLPEFIQDVDECRRCQFYGVACDPPLMSGAGASIITDPDVELMLDRRADLEESAAEFKKIDARIKAQFRGIDTGLAGKYLLQGSWGRNTTYDIPAEVKKQYMKIDPQGRFTLKITKVS